MSTVTASEADLKIPVLSVAPTKIREFVISWMILELPNLSFNASIPFVEADFFLTPRGKYTSEFAVPDKFSISAG